MSDALILLRDCKSLYHSGGEDCENTCQTRGYKMVYRRKTVRLVCLKVLMKLKALCFLSYCVVELGETQSCRLVMRKSDSVLQKLKQTNFHH
jgi:hypothetical protein